MARPTRWEITLREWAGPKKQNFSMWHKEIIITPEAKLLSDTLLHLNFDDYSGMLGALKEVVMYLEENFGDN